jgi:1-deoxy-D-xylulose 5-phosphate reductoisomerase
VEFSDRSVVAQLGSPDMRIPIAHCLGWPDRIVGPSTRLDLARIGQLTFEAPDFERFPGLRLAFEALRTGQGATTVFNAANEIAVAAFIGKKIRFGAIARLVEATLEQWVRGGNLAPLTCADDAILLTIAREILPPPSCLKLPQRHPSNFVAGSTGLGRYCRLRVREYECLSFFCMVSVR